MSPSRSASPSSLADAHSTHHRVQEQGGRPAVQAGELIIDLWCTAASPGPARRSKPRPRNGTSWSGWRSTPAARGHPRQDPGQGLGPRHRDRGGSNICASTCASSARSSSPNPTARAGDRGRRGLPVDGRGAESVGPDRTSGSRSPWWRGACLRSPAARLHDRRAPGRSSRRLDGRAGGRPVQQTSPKARGAPGAPRTGQLSTGNVSLQRRHQAEPSRLPGSIEHLGQDELWCDQRLLEQQSARLVASRPPA